MCNTVFSKILKRNPYADFWNALSTQLPLLWYSSPQIPAMSVSLTFELFLIETLDSRYMSLATALMFVVVVVVVLSVE